MSLLGAYWLEPTTVDRISIDIDLLKILSFQPRRTVQFPDSEQNETWRTVTGEEEESSTL